MSETLTWDSEELSGAIVCEDLGLLRAVMTRGANLVMPGAVGARPYAPTMDQLDVTLVWSVTGRFDSTGAPHENQETGVEQNLEHYRALFTTGADPATGEHDVSLSYAGTTYTGGIQVWDYAQVRTGPTTARIVTRIVVAAGELEEAGS